MVQLGCLEKRTLFLRSINLQLLGEGIDEGSLIRQHFIHFFQSPHLIFLSFIKEVCQWGCREVGEIGKLGTYLFDCYDV